MIKCQAMLQKSLDEQSLNLTNIKTIKEHYIICKKVCISSYGKAFYKN